MTLPYIALGITGTLAALRTRGFLRWWIAYEVAVTVALKIAFVTFGHYDPARGKVVWPLYDPIWRVAEPIGMALGAAVALRAGKPQRWPVYALAAAVVHGWAMSYPNRWTGSWLQAEIHLIAFVSLMLGLFLIGNRTSKESLTVALIFLFTAASYYTSPWNPDVQAWLMWILSGCYGCLAVVKNNTQQQRA